ncbi:PREDICTED: uncharacterized protein LOC106807016 [Priapulus caudatus]|uniref:Uncharacterized protein LOC106807016 n=1 Tax=Priapulus caudatus TaxID=37621 RepID=A0ABM1DXN2_PRICU|nr:PREDICTED: uncharacterized protein LOC106807016 [Priapulus caudatus]
MTLFALPIFQHLPIEFFGHPFIIESSETKHCLHGSAKDNRGGRNADSCDGEHDYGMSYRRFQGTRQVLNIVNTNNGVEAQNKLFKYSYLPKSVDKSAYGIVVLLVESFLPDSYQKYCDMNLKQSSQYRRITNLPGHLHNHPRHFVKNCLKRRFAAGEFQDIQCVDISKGNLE